MRVACVAIACIVGLSVLASGGAVETDQAQGEPSDEIFGLDGVVTLYAQDRLTSTYCLSTDSYAAVVRSGRLLGLGRQVEFGILDDATLSAIGSGSDRATLINLGSLKSTCPTAFFELRRDADRVFHATEGAAAGNNFEVMIPVFDGSQRAVTAHSGDICLLRIENLSMGNERHPVGGTAYFKILVLECRPGEALTFRWLEF